MDLQSPMVQTILVIASGLLMIGLILTLIVSFTG